MKSSTTHHERLHALRRAEGQIKGIQRMVEQEAYCIDIIIQLHAAINALYRISEDVFAKHLKGCVTDAFSGGSRKEKGKKVDEVVRVIKMLHKLE